MATVDWGVVAAWLGGACVIAVALGFGAILGAYWKRWRRL